MTQTQQTSEWTVEIFQTEAITETSCETEADARAYASKVSRLSSVNLVRVISPEGQQVV